MRYAGKTVWITGASSGIGEALARSFAKEGAHIILSGRRTEALETVAASIETDTLSLPFEATDYPVLADKVSAAWDWKGRVDILVNNAGVTQRSIASQTDPQVYTDLINIDLIAPIWLTQLQLPRMIEAGGAHIVAISSVAGRIGVPLRTAYCAAKHGLIGYMDALRSEETLRNNIQVTNILPGSVATNISRNALTATGEARGKSDDIIDAGDDPMDCAASILDAVYNKVPELIYADGLELTLAQMRHDDPEKLFELAGQFGAQIVEEYEKGNDDGVVADLAKE